MRGAQRCAEGGACYNAPQPIAVQFNQETQAMRGTLSDQFRGKHPFFWVVIVAAVISLCSWAFAGIMAYKYLGMSKTGYEVDNQMRVSRIYPGGPAEGKLQLGDAILAVNGTAVTHDVLRQTIRFMPIGTAYRSEVERKGKKQPIELNLRLHRSPYRSFNIQFVVNIGLVSLSCLFVAILAGLLRPFDTNVRLFFAAFYYFGQNLIVLLLRYPSLLFDNAESLIWDTYNIFFGPFLAFPLLFHLFLNFPPGVRKSRFWNIIKWVFYAVGITLHLVSGFRLRSPTPLYFGPLVLNFILSILVAIIFVSIRNYRVVSDAQQRKRIRWVIASIAVSCTAYILSIMILKASSLSMQEAIGPYLSVFSWLLILGIPISWTYAILKHRVLDISVVVRRSVRYLLASRGFILIESLLAFALLSFLFAGRLGAWLDRLGSNTRTLTIIVGTVLMVLGLQYVNRTVHPLIERRFFRDAYDAQQILTELTSSLRTTTNVRQVQELTAKIIQQALYAANVTIFVRNGQHDFQSAVSSDYHEREKLSRAVERDLHLPGEAFVLQRVHETRQPAEIDWDDPYSPVATQLAAMANGDASAQQEFDTLRELKTNLVLPLAAKDELLGVLALGPRAGDLPYSREDKRMLMNVAGQTAMALENSRLIEQKIEIEAEHNRKTQELEEARRLQLSMLPKGNLKLERVEITGTMRTATEVGGDYYDFLPLPDGRYCIVIGDATGHGMSAGLIVGMVKMGLTSRLQAQPQIQTTLQPMIEDLNTALKQSLAHRGVGMCLGATIIDPVTLQVELCSNGMPFPYHFTQGELRAIELKAQPLGFLKRVNVPTARLQLQPGEALIWVSDGFEERMNARHEEWGAAQVAAALTEICQREASGEAMARELMAACDRASDGRSNDDDMTIVVVKACT